MWSARAPTPFCMVRSKLELSRLDSCLVSVSPWSQSDLTVPLSCQPMNHHTTPRHAPRTINVGAESARRQKSTSTGAQIMSRPPDGPQIDRDMACVASAASAGQQCQEYEAQTMRFKLNTFLTQGSFMSYTRPRVMGRLFGQTEVRKTRTAPPKHSFKSRLRSLMAVRRRAH